MTDDQREQHDEDKWWLDPGRWPPGSIGEAQFNIGQAVAKLKAEIMKAPPFSWLLQCYVICTRYRFHI
jgi:hypothetical protein